MMEASGKAIGSFFAALKDQPLVLALCVMNFALIAFVFYQSKQFTEARAENVRIFVGMQGEMQKLLSQCVIPTR